MRLTGLIPEIELIRFNLKIRLKSLMSFDLSSIKCLFVHRGLIRDFFSTFFPKSKKRRKVAIYAAQPISLFFLTEIIHVERVFLVYDFLSIQMLF